MNIDLKKLYFTSHLDNVCGSFDIFCNWNSTLTCYIYFRPNLHRLRDPSYWGFQCVVILTSVIHYKSTVRNDYLMFRYLRFFCRWIDSVDDLSMIMYAKICILIHSLLNVYENAMVIICLIWFLNVKFWVADFGWKNTFSDKRTMGFVFWRGGNIRRAE